MRIITAVRANDDWTLDVSFADGVERRFDVKPLLQCEAFEGLRDISLLKQFAMAATLSNGTTRQT